MTTLNTREAEGIARLRQKVARCCYIHHPTLGSDPTFKSVPFENCAWCQNIVDMLAAEQARLERS